MMNMYSFGSPGISSTLPRQPHGHHWAGYGGSMVGIRHIPQHAVNQTPAPRMALPPSTIALQHLSVSSNIRPSTRICMSVPEEEISPNTPLMLKHDSTV